MSGSENNLIGAVDIGGSKIALGVFDQSGKCRFFDEFPTFRVKMDPDQAVREIASRFERCGLHVDGVGVSCTGPVYPDTGCIGEVEFLPGWSGYHLVDSLQKNLRVKVELENDANAAAYGEWKFGAGKDSSRFIMVTVGTGIGGGIILDRQIYHGAGGVHPEFGHMIINTETGPDCYCGSRGCWESLASGRAMEEWAKANHPQRPSLSGKQICEMASSGDHFAKIAVERTAMFLGIGIANLITTWAPEIICLGGGLMKAWLLFMPRIQQVVDENCSFIPKGSALITVSTITENAGLLGASQVWFQRDHRYW